MGQGVTNWSPPGSWCLVSLSAALSLISLLMLILWLVTCHYPSCPSPAHSRACSGPRPSPAARQHSTHCSLTHRAAHAVLSLWLNHLTTSKVLGFQQFLSSDARWMLNLASYLFWNSQCYILFPVSWYLCHCSVSCLEHAHTDCSSGAIRCLIIIVVNKVSAYKKRRTGWMSGLF